MDSPSGSPRTPQPSFRRATRAPLTPVSHAIGAIRTANENAEKAHAPGGRYAYIKPLQAGDVLRKMPQVMAAMATSGVVLGVMELQGVPFELKVTITSLTFVAMAAPALGRLGRSMFLDGQRGLSSQMLALLGGFLVKCALEQAAIHADSTIPGNPNFQASAPNATHTVDSPDWGEAAPWTSLALLGLPFLLMILDALKPPAGGSSFFDALSKRIEFDGTQPMVQREHETDAKLVRYGAPALTIAVAIGLIAGLAVNGHRTLMLRILAGCNATMITARLRDYGLHATDNIAAGGGRLGKAKPERFRTRQIIAIPKNVLDALEAACGGDAKLYADAKLELEKIYWKVWRNSRIGNMFSYGVSSLAGLYFMRLYLAPALGGPFAQTFMEAVANFLPAWLGSMLNEAWDDLGLDLAQRLAATLEGVPYEVKMGIFKDFLAQISKNLETVGGLSWAPGLRRLTYQASSVDKDGAPQLSGDEKIDLATTIRTFQNLAITIFLVAGGTLGGGTTLGLTMLMFAVMFNMLTEFRGSLATQVLGPGREDELKFHFQKSRPPQFGDVVVEPTWKEPEQFENFFDPREETPLTARDPSPTYGSAKGKERVPTLKLASQGVTQAIDSARNTFRSARKLGSPRATDYKPLSDDPLPRIRPKSMLSESVVGSESEPIGNHDKGKDAGESYSRSDSEKEKGG